jgi:DNA-directed RNA polymerase subunit RPC12/RpoP
MTFIKCLDCGKEISDQAPQCIQCGRRVGAAIDKGQMNEQRVFVCCQRLSP